MATDRPTIFRKGRTSPRDAQDVLRRFNMRPNLLEQTTRVGKIHHGGATYKVHAGTGGLVPQYRVKGAESTSGTYSVLSRPLVFEPFKYEKGNHEYWYRYAGCIMAETLYGRDGTAITGRILMGRVDTSAPYEEVGPSGRVDEWVEQWAWDNSQLDLDYPNQFVHNFEQTALYQGSDNVWYYDFSVRFPVVEITTVLYQEDGVDFGRWTPMTIRDPSNFVGWSDRPRWQFKFFSTIGNSYIINIYKDELLPGAQSYADNNLSFTRDDLETSNVEVYEFSVRTGVIGGGWGDDPYRMERGDFVDFHSVLGWTVVSDVRPLHTWMRADYEASVTYGHLMYGSDGAQTAVVLMRSPDNKGWALNYGNYGIPVDMDCDGVIDRPDEAHGYGWAAYQLTADEFTTYNKAYAQIILYYGEGVPPCEVFLPRL